jgi:tetratricopeptide (TPR) repeat protein
MRRALFLLVLAGWMDAGARGAEAPSPERQDLQAAAVVEATVLAQTQAGGDTREAVERLDQAFAALEAKYPRSAAVRDEHGNYLWWEQRQQEAFKKWQEAEKLDGNNAYICLHLGCSWLESGDTARAMGYIERAVALAPGDAMLHFTLGNDLYLFRHQLTNASEPETAVVDRALGELKKASDLAPMDAEYAQGYAETFYSLPVPKWPEAVKAWQRFYDISENKDVAAINLARISLLMKDKAAARRYLGKVTGAPFEGLKKKLMAQAGGA